MKSCETCRLRARYDANPKSLLGRFWKWHTRWCPGWKSSLKSLTPDGREKTSPTTDTSGKLRLKRVGSTITGYFLG